MLYLYQFEPKHGIPNVSPFCMKVETFLRMAKIPHAMKFVKDPRKAPKKKCPYIEDDGKIIADSSFILEFLTEKYNVTLDRDLNSQKLGIARMMTGALEERLYFAIVRSRWVDDKNWEVVREMWFKDLPPLIGGFIPNMVRKGVIKSLDGHGIGKHSADEIYRIGIRDLQGMVDLLGDQKYFLGNTPTSVDAVAFSFLANILKVPLPSPMQDFAAEQPALVDYCHRMGKRFYPEYPIFQ